MPRNLRVSAQGVAGVATSLVTCVAFRISFAQLRRLGYADLHANLPPSWLESQLATTGAVPVSPLMLATFDVSPVDEVERDSRHLHRCCLERFFAERHSNRSRPPKSIPQKTASVVVGHTLTHV